MKYAIVGQGRMGTEIDRQARARGHTQVSADDRAEVAFEFTTASAAEENVRGLIAAGCAVVCGTTGWVPSDALLERARGADRAVVLAANFSVGMNLFYRIVSQAGRLLGGAGQHDPYLVEVHHRGKRDAPSGTARKLADLLLKSDPRLHAVAEGDAHLPAQPGVLPVSSVRAGPEPGNRNALSKSRRLPLPTPATHGRGHNRIDRPR